jgi:flagellar biosynthesis regulator FlaF
MSETSSRTSISKRTRFEVFKRDSFKCQYCGASGPEVLLEVDHVTPISKGGSDDIMNLITACKQCNLGKGAVRLDDKTALSKKRNQLQELQERREQLEMMIEWQEELRGIRENAIDYLCNVWSELALGYNLNENGIRKLKKLLRRFSLEEIVTAVEIAAEHYLRYDKDGKPIHESVELAWQKTAGICHNRRREKENPELNEIYHLRAIAIKRHGYFNNSYGINLLEKAREIGITAEKIKSLIFKNSSWSGFKEDLEDIINAQD